MSKCKLYILGQFMLRLLQKNGKAGTEKVLVRVPGRFLRGVLMSKISPATFVWFTQRPRKCRRFLAKIHDGQCQITGEQIHKALLESLKATPSNLTVRKNYSRKPWSTFMKWSKSRRRALLLMCPSRTTWTFRCTSFILAPTAIPKLPPRTLSQEVSMGVYR